MAEIILALLLALAPHRADTETEEERLARLTTIQQSVVAAASGDAEVAAFLLMTGGEESHWAEHIHEGRCGAHECDGGLAATPWQVWRVRGMSAEQWEAMQGSTLEATTAAAKYAARLYLAKKRHCGSVRGGISAYATGRCGAYAQEAERRERLMQRILERIKG